MNTYFQDFWATSGVYVGIGIALALLIVIVAIIVAVYVWRFAIYLVVKFRKMRVCIRYEYFAL